MKVGVAATALALSLAGCAYQGPSQFLDQAYLRRDHSRFRLAIAQLPYYQLRVRNAQDFDDDFLPDPDYRRWLAADPARASGRAPWYVREQYLNGEFSARARQAAAKRWKVQIVPRAPDLLGLGPDRLVKVSHRLGQRTLELELPTAETLREQGVEAEFLLVFERVLFDRGVVESIGFMPAAQAGGPPGMPAIGPNRSPALEAGGFYAIYDLRARRIVSCGRAIGHARYTFSTDRDDWYLAIDDLVGDVRDPF